MKNLLTDTAANAYQSIIMTYFLVQCLGNQERYNRKMTYAAGSVLLFLYFELQNFMIPYKGVLMKYPDYKIWINPNESIGIFFVPVITLLFSVIFLKGRVISKLFYNGILLGILFFSSLLAKNMSEIYYQDEVYRVFSSDAVTAAFFLFILVGFILYGTVERQRRENLQKEMEISSLRRQKQDVEEMNRRYRETEKVRHEIYKILSTVENLLADGKAAEAEEFVKEFREKEIVPLEKVIYTDNIVLNYLLNQKIEQCRQEKINIKCIVSGIVDGIRDIDLHCIVSNLLDNAIEAVEKIPDKNIECSIYGNDYSLYIEVSNTVAEDIVKNNPHFGTTKQNHFRHGFGIQNIRDTVLRYQGEIRYKQNLEKYLTCQVVLLKQSEEETLQNTGVKQI